MNNSELDKALDKAYIECVQHLDTITCTDVVAFNFNFDGEHTYTCMCQLVEPLKVKFHDFAIEDFQSHWQDINQQTHLSWST